MSNSDALVFFGATGDLAYKQIFPALAGLIADGRLNMPVIGVAKAGWNDEQLGQRARESLAEQGITDEATVGPLVAALRYVDGDYRDPATFQKLREQLGSAKAPLFYLAIPPALFGTVAKALGDAGFAKGGRVVVEKPFGHDLASAQELNALLHQIFPEDAIYRVDHFLGKEAVLGLLYFRFANAFPETFWNRFYIDSVQITMAETFGVAGRGAFYDKTGVIRDVVQNHLLQVLSLLAMEPPGGYGHQDIRPEKAKVLRAMPPLRPNDVVRGQFAGYLDEDGVAADSTVETFVALRAHIDNWRWAGVPFFIRAGKKLPVTATEAVIRLRRPPAALAGTDRGHPPNYVRFRLSPDGGIAFGVTVKAPGESMHANDVELAAVERPSHFDLPPYQRLLGDALVGDASLFATEQGVEASWAVVDPVLEDTTAPHRYAPGTWGPEEAQRLAASHGGWHDPVASTS
ncbi:glucose-6-phosphate 1-dehydrogenase [Asanoa ferruginea]|uniref:Glucose-6-phosphate 1-dehydrogenase n=1 Tax=Asanoa ferruginea TaxID=53367 RepID=A0A3D9ZYT9_9ACTN|nr:glucose-6-phosphate dehydrogenase [Asanoa ferruginea]REG01793.1 glucose-6-phosphate 1-dehydrogenase [Asanoa ferruginea]GIF49173.1 glucose-6-phosphate 1-dehydrogenase [Asanoa ferruginea]